MAGSATQFGAEKRSRRDPLDRRHSLSALTSLPPCSAWRSRRRGRPLRPGSRGCPPTHQGDLLASRAKEACPAGSGRELSPEDEPPLEPPLTRVTDLACEANCHGKSTSDLFEARFGRMGAGTTRPCQSSARPLRAPDRMPGCGPSRSHKCRSRRSRRVSRRRQAPDLHFPQDVSRLHQLFGSGRAAFSSVSVSPYRCSGVASSAGHIELSEPGR